MGSLTKVLPPGDVLAFCGDATHRGTIGEWAEFLGWYGGQPHRHKILVAGNHELCLERQPALAWSLIPPSVTYLEDRAVTLDGVTFYGSPWHPRIGGWAFGADEAQLSLAWQSIPDDTNVLLTHGPPAGILDRVPGVAEGYGCGPLRARVRELKQLRVHAFGHVHEGAGRLAVDGVEFVNCSVFRGLGETPGEAVVVDL